MGYNQSPTGGDFILGSPATTPVSEATVNLTGGLLDVSHTDITDTFGGNIASGGNMVGVGTFAFNFTGGTLKVRRWNAPNPLVPSASLGNLKQNGATSVLDITGNNTELLQTSKYDLGAGTANIGGGRTFTTNGVLNSGVAGDGTINVGDGGGTAFLTAGADKIEVDNLNLNNGDVTAAMGVEVATSLTGNGTINNNVTMLTGSSVSPGLSIGTLAFGQDLNLAADPTMMIDVNGDADTSDLLQVLNDVTLGGSFLVNMLGANTPMTGEFFDVITWGNTQSGTLPTVAGDWSTSIVGNAVRLTYTGLFGALGSGSSFEGGAVPEPSSCLLIGLAIAGLVGIRRGQRR
jgi:hypothetical protein